MRSLLFFLVACFALTAAQGQGYEFSASAGDYKEISNARLLKKPSRLHQLHSIALPFSFTYYNHTYNTLYVGSTFVGFDDDLNYTVDVFGADMADLNEGPNSAVRYEISADGKAITVQWTDMRFEEDPSGEAYANYQVTLSASGEITITMGDIVAEPALFDGGEGHTGPGIGLTNEEFALYHYAVGTPDRPMVDKSMPVSLDGIPAPGQTYTFSLNPSIAMPASIAVQEF